MFDVRNAEGQIVHVNIEDINQFLTYHEVFGKIGNADHFPSTSGGLPPSLNPTLTAASMNQAMPGNHVPPTPLIIPKIENIPSSLIMDQQNSASATTSSSAPSNASTTGTSITTNSIINTTCAPIGTGTVTDDQAAMPSPAMHTCDICGKMFPFKYQFIVHRRYHNERKPFICQVCGQAFTSSVELTHHGKAHDGNKMFTCNICYNVFANDASLERHMKRHSTDKPFGCTVCQKTFARKEHLDNHFRSHTGETPFRYIVHFEFVCEPFSVFKLNLQIHLVEQFVCREFSEIQFYGVAESPEIPVGKSLWKYEFNLTTKNRFWIFLLPWKMGDKIC